VHVDPERIAWVLDNVLKNALEVSALGQRVEIRSLRGGTECRVEVKDEGPGIRPEHLSRIFTPSSLPKTMGAGSP